MSCCLILQTKDNVFIGADTAISEIVGNEFVRKSNDGKKLFEAEKDIVYCSGDMSYVPDIIENMKIVDGHVDVEHISGYLKKTEFRKCPLLDAPSIAVIVCRVVDGISYVYSLEPKNNFNVVTRTVNQDGIQIWVTGIYNEKCMQIVSDEINRFQGEVINTYVNTYKKMACPEIGGNINVYYLNSNGYEKIIDNYDLKDIYTASFYGIVAENLVGKMIVGDRMIIGNKNDNVLISGSGIDITNGSLYITNDTYSIELDPNKRLKKLCNYLQNSSIDNMRDDFLFCIRNKKVPIDEENSDVIMGIDTSGNGYFKGRIEAREGKIANFNISEDKLCTDNVEFGDSNGIYFGKNGLSIGDNFKVGNDGDCSFQGAIKATTIIAKEQYNVYSNGHEIPLISGSCAANGLRWTVNINAGNGKGVTLKEINYLDDNGKRKVETNINTEFINLNGDTAINGDTRIKGDLYSKTGSIITSDRNVKDNIKPLTDKHVKFFSLLQPVSFIFKDELSGRKHIGFISQDVEDAMKKVGISDLDFAGFCKKHKKIEITDENGNTTYDVEKDENGNPVYFYYLRYEEFIALNTFMIQNLYVENQDIKERLLRLENLINHSNIIKFK